MCLHIDGALTFTHNLITELLESALTNNADFSKFETLQSFCVNSVFFTSTNMEIKVETSFLILSILSHLIRKRPELMLILKFSKYYLLIYRNKIELFLIRHSEVLLNYSLSS